MDDRVELEQLGGSHYRGVLSDGTPVLVFAEHTEKWNVYVDGKRVGHWKRLADAKHFLCCLNRVLRSRAKSAA